jgi:hypothetical protein
MAASSHKFDSCRALQIQTNGSGLSEDEALSILSRIPIVLGQGKVVLPLSDVMPSTCMVDLLAIMEAYARGV